jgi:hypothetical protein
MRKERFVHCCSVTIIVYAKNVQNRCSKTHRRTSGQLSSYEQSIRPKNKIRRGEKNLSALWNLVLINNSKYLLKQKQEDKDSLQLLQIVPKSICTSRPTRFGRRVRRYRINNSKNSRWEQSRDKNR